MTSAADVAARLLNFRPEEFAAFEQVDVSPREIALLDSDFVGIAINAPAHVPLGEQSTIPIAVATRYDGVRDFDVPIPDNCLLFATSLADGRVQIAPGLLTAKAMESRAGRAPVEARPRPAPEALEGHGAQISWTEATERLEIPWLAGRWALGAIYFNWISNVVPVDLVGGEPAPPATARPTTPLPASAAGFPTYLQRPGMPAMPNRGLDFVVALETGAGAQRLNVTGAFSVTARPFSVTKPQEMLDCGHQMAVCASVPVTFVVVRLGSPWPLQFDWSVPVYGPPVMSGDKISGFFTLDALKNGGVGSLAPGSYASYAIVDGLIFGPRMIDVKGK